MDTLANPILQVLDDYKAAVFAKDVDAFIARYDEDVVAFDMWGVWSYNGIAAYRQMVTGWFGSLGTDRVIVDFTNAQPILSQDLAVIHTFVSYKAITPDGTELRSMDNRLSLTLRHKGGEWKIVHQHSSSPIEFETTKAMFKR